MRDMDPVTAGDPADAGAADVSFTAAHVQMAMDGLGMTGGGTHTTDEFADLSTLPMQTIRVRFAHATNLSLLEPVVEYVEIPDDLAGIQKPDTTVYLQWVETPLGPMLCGATEHAICLLEFTDRPLLPTQMARVQKRFHCRFENIANAMTEQFADRIERVFRQDKRTLFRPIGLSWN